MGTISTSTISPSELLGKKQFNEFISSALTFKAKSEWKGDKRFYITFLPNISEVNFGNSEDRRDVINYNIRTKLTGSFDDSDGSKVSSNLAELSTTEIVLHNPSENQLTLDSKFPLNQQYIARKHVGNNPHNHSQSPPIFNSGSYLISKINDDNPSLLIELNKDQSLPNGLGDKEFIVIPENLHPYVKDNLEYFLTRAGINISGDASQYIKLDKTNQNLP